MVIIAVLFHSSDLDPVQAPHWSVRVRKADNPQCLLGKVHHHVPFLKCHISTYFPNWNPENILYTLFHLFKILSFIFMTSVSIIFLLTAIAGFLSFKNLYFSILCHILIYCFAFLMYYVTFSSGTVCIFS